VLLSGVLKRTSSKLTKICNDIRLLASGRAAASTRSTCRRCSRAARSCRAR
jgi:aspartate ammonia-lyase